MPAGPVSTACRSWGDETEEAEETAEGSPVDVQRPADVLEGSERVVPVVLGQLYETAGDRRGLVSADVAVGGQGRAAPSGPLPRGRRRGERRWRPDRPGWRLERSSFVSNRLRPVLGSVARERGRDGALTRRGGHRGSTVTEAVRDVLAAEGPTYTALRPVPSRQLPAEMSQ
ncbi:hypothetical protein GCM10020254_15700 [Streptomyces goshikiensis]